MNEYAGEFSVADQVLVSAGTDAPPYGSLVVPTSLPTRYFLPSVDADNPEVTTHRGVAELGVPALSVIVSDT